MDPTIALLGFTYALIVFGESVRGFPPSLWPCFSSEDYR
jgi:hypothetical protein